MNLATWKLVRRMNCHRLDSAAKATNAATTLAAARSAVDRAWASSQIAATSTSVRQARPNSKRRLKPPLKPMLFHAAVEGPAAQAELAGRKRDVEMMHAQCPLDHLLFKLVEV